MKKITDYSRDTLLISPSLLAADFASLQTELARIEKAGAELLHLDVMDGHFVPNLTFGPPVVASLRKHSQMLFDAHFMLTHPIDFIQPFVKAGVEHITFHIECIQDPRAVIQAIRDAGVTVGISLKPKTDPSLILPYLSDVDMVLVMSVEPGFGGQSFMSEVLSHVRLFSDYIIKNKLKTHIEIDGGIDEKTAPLAKAAGVNVLVAGTALFRHPKGEQYAMEVLRK